MFNDPELPHARNDWEDAGFDSSDMEEASAAPARFGRLAICVAAASALAFGVVGTVAYGVWFNSDQQTYAEAIARARQALRMPSASAAPVLANSPGVSGTSMSPADLVPPTPATVAAVPDMNAAISAAPLATSAMNTSSSAAPAPINPTANLPTGRPGTFTTAQNDIPLLSLPAPPDPALASATEDDRKPSTWSGQVTLAAAAAATVAAATAPASAALAENEKVIADPASPAPFTVAAAPRAAQRAAGTPEPQAASSRPARDVKYAQQERRNPASNARHKGNLFAKVGSFFRRVSYRQHGSGSQQDLYSHP
ncbi:hypothetical protein VOM14_12355 [Paraburkholderia sp. MPAMCS5]|uniref:hypothetical protein n=1 Tax=Paraburkholderia sp. MPAMCS5 TaxID=3112563 RepID=UPI002E183CF8|nr:hypothetical protein [Paraburkholderia sp. MPAMCS5]